MYLIVFVENVSSNNNNRKNVGDLFSKQNSLFFFNFFTPYNFHTIFCVGVSFVCLLKLGLKDPGLSLNSL